MRKSTLYLLYVSANGLLLFFLLLIYPLMNAKTHQSRISAERALVGSLELTDLCLFTEARYTRHLSQSDLHSPFQDHPTALEHFPSGSLVSPPARLRETAP